MKFPVVLVREIQRVGGGRLRHDDARTLGDEAERFHHVEAGAERADVAEVAARNDDDVRHRPVELLDDFNAHRFLAFEPQAVHRVRQVDAFFHREPLHDGHAAVEVRVQ